jgi:hypothetical protein
VLKPKKITKTLVDADIVSYRAASGTEGSHPDDTIDKVDTLMQYIVDQTVVFPTKDNLEVYLTGVGNFRYDIAKTAPYKGNRKDVVKPTNLPQAREHLVERWGAIVSQGEEADDLISISAMNGDPESTVICSQDKDFMTIKGWMFNFVTGTWKYSTDEDARRYFYSQVLTGDRADNILGLFRIGPKKAGAILEGLTTEEDLFDACLKAYQDHPTLEGDPYERLIENARLLHLRRYEGQIWEAPK